MVEILGKTLACFGIFLLMLLMILVAINCYLRVNGKSNKNVDTIYNHIEIVIGTIFLINQTVLAFLVILKDVVFNW